MTSTSATHSQATMTPSASTSAAGSNSVDEDEDFLFNAFKKLKVDPQWCEDSIVNDVSTEALRDLWAGKNSKTRSRTKQRGSKSRKKHRSRSELPYSVESLPCMDKLTLSQEKCSCSSCTQCREENLFNFSASTDLASKSLLREARLKLHHNEKDRKNVISKAKLNLRKQESKSPPGANAFIPDAIFGAKSKSSAFADVKSPSVTLRMTSEFGAAPLFSDHDEESSDSVHEVKVNPKRREHRLHRLHRTCSQEAKLDEMTVDELAGYLEDFVYLPKKMSEMAEMMYT